MLFLISMLVGGTGLFFYSKDTNKMSENINNSFDPLFIKHGTMHGVNWKVLKRISWIESRIGIYKSVALGIKNNNDVKNSVSQDGKSWGIMQTTIETSQAYDKAATPQKLNNPDYSIMIAAKHIAFLKKYYPSFSERDLIMSYNHGQGNQLRFIEKEKNRTLKDSEFLAGRDYFRKYLKAKELIP